MQLREALSTAAATTVYLAVPPLRLGQANADKDSSVHGPRFWTQEEDCPDENGSEAVSIEFRRHRARLLLEHDDRSDFGNPSTGANRLVDPGGRPAPDRAGLRTPASGGRGLALAKEADQSTSPAACAVKSTGLPTRWSPARSISIVKCRATLSGS